MEKVLEGFLQRNLPACTDRFHITLTGDPIDKYALTAKAGCVFVTASNPVSACTGIYDYLKKYCHIQLSWCGNRVIDLQEPVMFDGVFSRTIVQKYRVYMNYCTLDYSMCWWDFARWEKEIDFMAMNGINMPLAVIGTEAVWFETLLEFGFSESEALSWISGPAFWAWQLMTNINGYLSPPDKSYVYDRLALGRQILARYLEFGMYPIQQGFSGHVPALLRKKFPDAHILDQKGWCGFPVTAQLDPLDPLFLKFGKAYLQTLERLFGTHHFLACDPFHEGTPPKRWRYYLKAVGKTINRLYEEFDPQSVWVMQAWTMRKHIVKAVPRNRLLILDLNSQKTPLNRNMWGYPVISGMLHNFGGKNALQGKLEKHCKNRYLQLKARGANVVGTGMFMEGIEQNPVIYDLQFELMTSDTAIDAESWLRDYITRRYKTFDESVFNAWKLFLQTCYRSSGYEENAVGSMVAARPGMEPAMTGPCCRTKFFYDPGVFERAVRLFASAADRLGDSDGYQYDLCDFTRQALSNRFHTQQTAFANAFKQKDTARAKELAQKQLELLADLDALLAHRSELCLARWICDSHALATDETQRRYFDRNARTLISLWGDVNGTCAYLYDYAWREWNGMIKEFYAVRWEMFYSEAVAHLENGTEFPLRNTDNYLQRKNYVDFPLGKRMNEFEQKWASTYSEYAYPTDSDVVPDAKRLLEKWHIG